MASIDKLQRGRLKRAELPDVNINTGVQSINTERTSLRTCRIKGPSVRHSLANQQRLTQELLITGLWIGWVNPVVNILWVLLKILTKQTTRF